ncbi:hypothetical protein TSMEX_011692 [Taenia solium]|eukprot:TsM_001142500 transcript=TsM_001142500 gene=TsM_001142500
MNVLPTNMQEVLEILCFHNGLEPGRKVVPCINSICRCHEAISVAENTFAVTAQEAKNACLVPKFTLVPIQLKYGVIVFPIRGTSRGDYLEEKEGSEASQDEKG